MNTRIYLSSPHMSGDEQKYIREAFDQNWVAPLGPNVDGFEKEIGQFLDISNVAALSSGTSAIHLALILLNIKQGDEVLVSSFTFSATVNPIVYQGAVPVLIDSEPDSWNMDPDLLEEAINDRIRKNKKPKAIIIVHLYGMPANLDRILSIAKQYEIPVIEDAAEALGSKFKGRYCGTFGLLGILSFNGNKIITTSGGGALLSENAGYIQLARKLATQARDQAPHYEHTLIGYNYRLSNVLAGIGRGQLEVLNERIDARRKNNELYRSFLADIPEISFLSEPDERYFSNFWLTTILVDSPGNDFNRETIRLYLDSDNIESRPLWKPMHLQPVFRQMPAYINGVSEKLFEKGLCLPSASNLSLQEMERVVKKIKELVK
jgi:dTDP-4-amino-4,6-dideoxygalactose transaminase